MALCPFCGRYLKYPMPHKCNGKYRKRFKNRTWRIIVDANEYQELCKRTDSPEFNFPNVKLLHAAMGCVTESAELMDAMKKAMFYGRKIDRTNIIEELGDLSWYISQALTELRIGWPEIWERNIAKLKARYPQQFDADKANHRDLDQERKALESEDADVMLKGKVCGNCEWIETEEEDSVMEEVCGNEKSRRYQQRFINPHKTNACVEFKKVEHAADKSKN